MKLFYAGVTKKEGFFEMKPPGASIGRELDNDIILDEEGASRYHAKLLWRDGQWFLKDLGSTNGTKLNGFKIADEIKLNEGDEICVGYQKLVFAEKLDRKPQADIGMRKPEDSPKELPREKPKPEAKEKSDTRPAGSFMNFFSGARDKAGEEVSPQCDEGAHSFFSKRDDHGQGKEKKKHASPLFYIIIVLIAFIFVAAFVLVEKVLKANAAPRPGPPAKKVGVPLLVIYEKQTCTPDNIFRYELNLKDRQISATRDDLKHHFKLMKKQEITPEQVKILEDELKQTDFMKLEQPQTGVSPDNTDETKTLTIAYGTNLNTIRIKNTFDPPSFLEAVNTIEDFATKVLNIPKPAAQTAEEMREDAEKAFADAEMKYANYRAGGGNLSEAIKKYDYVVELLSFFEPKPEKHDLAYQKAQEARKILDDEVKAHGRNAKQAEKLHKYEEARDEYKKVVEKLPPDDPRYKSAEKQFLLLEKLIRTTRKKK